VNLAIGLFHPPFGINIFVAQSVLGLKLETIYRGIIPFVIIYHLEHRDTAGHDRTQISCIALILSTYLAYCPGHGRTRSDTPRRPIL